MAFALLLWLCKLSKNGPYTKLSYGSRFHFSDWHITHQLKETLLYSWYVAKGEKNAF